MSSANIDRFCGFADDYDAVRPGPPAAAIDFLCEVAEAPVPALVVDVGSGTGLSTRIWMGRAARIVGIEPNADMRRCAERATPAGAAEYRSGRADATGLPDGCADIVTCVQALHWMDPAPTLAEVTRCLRDGGVFAALDCDWPPAIHWRLLAPWQALRDSADRVVERDGLAPGLQVWEKTGHLERMRQSGRFRAVMEVCFHVRTSGDADRLVALAKSQGDVATALKAASPEVTHALGVLADEARTALGDRVVPWTYTYRTRVGVK